MDAGHLVGGIFIDLKKAFDTESHSILLHKLKSFGIAGLELDWFSSYLYDRKQATKVGNVVSEFEIVQSSGVNTSPFLSEFEEFLSNVDLLSGRTLVLGDFNIHCDLPSKPEVKQFCTILSSMGYRQLVDVPTHRLLRTLDLLIVKEDETLVSEWDVNPTYYSDHLMINCVLDVTRVMISKTFRVSRNFKAIDQQIFATNLAEKINSVLEQGHTNVNDLVKGYNNACLNVLDTHAPVKSKLRSVRFKPKWYNDDVIKARRERRRYERRWRTRLFDVNKIRCELDLYDPCSSNSTTSHENQSVVSCNLFDFQLITEDDLCKIIGKCPTKSCPLDPMPTWLVKQHLDTLAPILTAIVNVSLSSGVFPAELSKAVITPVLKKPSLDRNLLSNYRPVSNLRFVGKLIEKVVSTQVSNYINVYQLSDPYQSAYKVSHSTETALTCVQNDILRAIDNQRAVLLLMLDLSAAFNTVDHGILLERFAGDFGIKGKVQNWFKTYLGGRTGRVHIDGVFSDDKNLIYGVPQGSVIGPQAFT
ncbi:uncharacterized protein [Amphiura filiformis]|uniref:uncharacterized protein n=1 Tax=Amphiura filiformis TaxID=82378 RepID=UPI003B21C074